MNYLRPNNNNINNKSNLLSKAASDLESMRCLPADDDSVDFPMTARTLLYSLPGNQNCVDCGALHPQWASVSYGALLCLQCSGKHRSYGVQTSFVRSVDMDTWSHRQVLRMLEGGNEQLQQFFDRHRMGNNSSNNSSNNTIVTGAVRATGSIFHKRYHTKAAAFYRTHLAVHAQEVGDAGRYRGREASRQKHCGSSDDDCSTESESSEQQQRQRAAVQHQQQQEQHCSQAPLQPQQHQIAVQ